jgi:hypothetical protein
MFSIFYNLFNMISNTKLLIRINIMIDVNNHKFLQIINNFGLKI